MPEKTDWKKAYFELLETNCQSKQHLSEERSNKFHRFNNRFERRVKKLSILPELYSHENYAVEEITKYEKEDA